MTQACCALGLVTREWAQLHAERNWCHSGLRLVPLLFCHNGTGAATSRKAVHLAACVLSSDDRRSASGRCLSAPLFRTVGALVSSPFLFSPTRPSAVAIQPIIKLSCLFPHLPPTRILSLSLAEKLLNSCCHGRQRTVLSIPILASAVCYNFRFDTFGPIARSAHFFRIVLLPFVYLFCLSFLMRTLLAFFDLSSVVSVCFLQVLSL